MVQSYYGGANDAVRVANSGFRVQRSVFGVRCSAFGVRCWVLAVGCWLVAVDHFRAEDFMIRQRRPWPGRESRKTYTGP
jgi:hypothetical protein